MENLSSLKLFNSVLKADVSDNISSASSSSSSKSADKAGGFEDVFKSYLDRSQDAQSSQTTGTQDAQAVSADTSAQASKDPETPEEVIDSLNIPDDVKDELKKMLSEIDTKDDADAFMQELMAAMQTASMTVSQVEQTLSDFASSLMSVSKTDSIANIAPTLLDKALDQIVAMQTKNQDPKALFTLDDSQSDQTQTLTVVDQTKTDAQAQTQNQTAQTAQTTAKPVSDDGKTLRQESAEAAPEVKTAEVKTADTAEVDEKVVDIAAKKADASTDSQNSNNSDFLAKTPLTEKVITTEIKIEKPQDIMKFAELVEIAKNQGASKITVQLNPLELGKVNIELTEHAGKITGKVSFENENARDLFASGAESLKQQLADKGVVVENLEFLFKDFDQHQFAGWDNKQNNKSGGASDGSLTADSEEEAEQEQADDSVIYA